jgi:hypothetical protein
MATKKKKGRIKKTYPSHNIEGRDLSNTVFQKWIQVAIDLMHDGYSTGYIREYITANKQGSTKVTAIDTIMKHANEKVVSNQFVKDYEVVAIHLKRYNLLIKELKATVELPYPTEEQLINDPYAYEKWAASRNKKIKAFIDTLATMRQKQDLLKLHDGIFVDWNTEQEILIKQMEEKPKINIGKLSFQDQVELYQLVKKSRDDDFDLIGVIQGNTANKADVIDVVAEVVQGRANIEDIEQLPIPVEPYISPVSHFDPTVKLRETLRKLAAKKIEEAGGKLTDEEKQILK